MESNMAATLNTLYRKGGSAPVRWLQHTSAVAAAVDAGYVKVEPMPLGLDRARLTDEGRVAIERQLGIRKASVLLDVGDRVTLSAVFCTRVGLTGPATTRRGTVVRVCDVAVPAVYVEWDDGVRAPLLAVNLRRVA